MGLFEGTILAALKQAEREQLETRCERLAFKPNATIVFRGEILHGLYLLEKGRAEAHYRLRRARASLALSAGDFFGERALGEDAVCDSDVRAICEASVLVVPSQALCGLLAADEAVARALAERVESRRIALWSASGVLRSLPSFN